MTSDLVDSVTHRGELHTHHTAHKDLLTGLRAFDSMTMSLESELVWSEKTFSNYRQYSLLGSLNVI